MRKTAVLLLTVLLCMPVAMLADNYTQLWKNVEEAEKKDLPKTQIAGLQVIADKAEANADYGQLLKAEWRMISVWTMISPDSLQPRIDNMADKAARYEATDKALAAVYYAVLGKAYKDCRQLGTDNGIKASAFFKKAMADPAMLASKKATDYEPFVIEGRDSRIFNDDLLSLIGYTAEDWQTMHSYYMTTRNRAATMLTALEMVRQKSEADGLMYCRELRKSRYAVSLDSLINIYSDLKACGEVAVARYNYMKTCNDVKTEDLVAYINNAVSRWGEWPAANSLRNELKRLTNPEFKAGMEQDVLLPGKTGMMKLDVRNISEIKVKVARVAVEGSTKLTPENDNDYKTLRKKVMPFTERVQIKKYLGQPEYKIIEDSVVIDALPAGVYLMEITADNKNIKPVRRLLYVTDMYVVHQQLPGKKLRIAAVSATTGQPVPGARVELRTSDDKLQTVTCDSKGEFVLDVSKSPMNMIRAYTDKDKAAPFAGSWNNFSYYDRNTDRDVLNLFTDRKIYRPGQTVHVAAVLLNSKNGTELKAAAGRTFTLTLKDANYKTVSEAKVKTDNYGTASADFILPSGGLTGIYSVRADIPGSSSTRFNVEEYKRPTFQVEFPEINHKYQNGDTLVVTAHAKSYAGVPVQGAKVRYTVRRSQALWWRYYNYGTNSNAENSSILLEGEAVTDNTGAFKVEIPMLLPAWGGDGSGIDEYTFKRIARFYTITAEADVTDQSGETRSGTLKLPLGSKPTAFSCDMPDKIVRDSLKTITFVLKNSAGMDIDDTVKYYIDGSFNAFTAKTNSPSEVAWNTASMLKSGRHTLKAICGNDTIKKDFTVFSMDDTKPCVSTHDWFYLSGTSFPRDSRTVWLQIGSSDPDTHILYTVISGDKVIANGTADLSNEILTRKIEYKEEYGDGLLLNFAWVKDGKMYSHRETIERPLPDKRLTLKWTTFRDRLTPGQNEEWTLNITKPDGTPADAQLMATLYDSSLDQIVPFNWNFYTSISLNLPYAQWKTAYYNALYLNSAVSLKLLDVEGLQLNMFDMDNLCINRTSIGSFPMNKPLYVRGYGSMKSREEVSVQDAAALTGSVAQNKEGAMIEKPAMAGSVAEETADRQENNVQLRENLNETAFFYPALQADANGNVNIKFTLPESITTWRFMGFAHDEEMNNGQISGETVARKTVMIQPNMPRFVRVGDRTSITARIFNTSEKNVKGTAMMQLVDPETEKTVFEQRKQFAVDVNSTGNVSFDYYPDAGSTLLICRISATGKNFSDGEQHYLPVLSDEELTTNTVPFTQNGPGVKTIDLKDLFPAGSKNGKLTVEYTNNPAWLMIQALPYIGNSKDDNAISLAVAYYANSISSYLLKQSPRIKTVFEQWKREERQTSLSSSLERNQELKNLVLDETPWLADANNEAARKQLLANYFDDTALSHNISTALSKLAKLQSQTDGSWCWWQGMPYGSPYLTAGITELLTRLNTMTGRDKNTDSMIDKAMSYLGSTVVKMVKEMKKAEKEGRTYHISEYYALQYLYICALDGRKLTAEEKTASDYLLEYLKKKNTSLSLYGKSLMAAVLAHKGERRLAAEYVKSLNEYSVSTEETGRYYDSPRAGYSWFDYRIPTQVAAIEAMTLIDAEGNAKTINEMKRWLLHQKRVQDWNTPINSVNAVYVFLNGNTSVLASQERTKLAIDGKQINPSEATAGLGYVKSTIDAGSANEFTATKTSEGTSWGAVYAQSVQKMSSITAASSGFTVTREVTAANGSKLTDLKVGDRVKVKITVKADRDYDFVQIKDKRAACMEPVSQLSGYRYGYYCAPKDYSTNYYFDRLSKGTHVIETEYYIDRAGRYETGTCTVQCAYSPEYSARTISQTIEVK